MGKVKFAVRVKDKNISISTDDTGINILKYLALIAVRVISEMSVEHEKDFAKKALRHDHVCAYKGGLIA